MNRRRWIPALGAAAVIPAQMARADEAGISFGVHLVVSLSGTPRVGIGLDVRGSATFMDDNFCDPAVDSFAGVFGQATYMFGPWRFALGLHAGSTLSDDRDPGEWDVELGYTYRTGSYGWTGGHGVWLGGLVWDRGIQGTLAGTMSFVDGGLAPEAHLGIGARFPPPSGFGSNVTCVEGRPLRCDGETVLAPLVVRRPDARVFEDPTAATWLRAARTEAASVPVFAALARDLGGVGAPRELVRRARRAAADEVRHARLCAAMAARGTDAHIATGLLPTPPAPLETEAATITRMALESWRDGCLGEGDAAHRARLARDRATDAETRAAQGRIADDEAAHAELAWHVLAHCLDRDPTVRERLAADVRAPTDDASDAAQRRLASLL